MIKKKKVCSVLYITSKKLQRLCSKHREELETLGYVSANKTITDPQFQLIRTKLEAERNSNYENFVDFVKKSQLAEKLGISSKTLAKWLHMPMIYNKLTKAGYKKSNKKLSPDQYKIFNKHIGE